MHSSFVRVQNLFGFWTTVVTVIGCLIAASDLLHERSPSASVQPVGTQITLGRPPYYQRKKEESAMIRFDLDADLSSLFTWNTKEVFVYVTAEWVEYNRKSNSTNTAVIWDQIITSPSSDFLSNIGPIAKKKLLKSGEGKSIDPSRGIFHLKNQKAKYRVTNPQGKMAERKDLQLHVHYNVQPWIGLLSWNQEINSEGSEGSEGGLFSWLPKSGIVWSPRWKTLAGGISEKFDLPPAPSKKKQQQ